jgi:DNA-binding NarL/FixJ family response regulator
VLILTTFGSAADISRALNAGATGAVTKNLSNDDLMKAIRSTRDGVYYVSPEIEQSLNEDNGEISLSPRQREVLDSITRGLSNDNIASLLGISKSRVKQHLNELYDKLGAANRAEAVSIALRKHLLKI